MLILPSKKIRKIQLKLGIILLICSSIMIIVVQLPSPSDIYRQYNPPETESFDGALGSNSRFIIPNFIITLILFLGSLVLIVSLFFWFPSLTSLVPFTEKGHMTWGFNRLQLPERQFIIESKKGSIYILRKRSSINGFLLKEFILTIHLEKNSPEIERLVNFAGIEKVEETSTHIILLKSVETKYLPLQIIQVMSLLALTQK